MQFKKPKDDSKYTWTNHVIDKMAYYGISESLIKRIVRNPVRTEEGVAENTSAAMQPKRVKETVQGKPKKWDEEIWVMYQQVKSQITNRKLQTNSKSQITMQAPKLRIISAWRYPGMSPKRSSVPIPDEILQELDSVI